MVGREGGGEARGRHPACFASTIDLIILE